MKKVLIIIFLAFAAVFVHMAVQADDIPRMTKEQLRARLGSPDLVIIDVRVPNSWKNSNDKIKGAIRENPMDVLSWIKKYPDKNKTYVFYCS